MANAFASDEAWLKQKVDGALLATGSSSPRALLRRTVPGSPETGLSIRLRYDSHACVEGGDLRLAQRS
jgi:hypothetical protein